MEKIKKWKALWAVLFFKYRTDSMGRVLLGNLRVTQILTILNEEDAIGRTRSNVHL